MTRRPLEIIVLGSRGGETRERAHVEIPTDVIEAKMLLHAYIQEPTWKDTSQRCARKISRQRGKAPLVMHVK